MIHQLTCTYTKGDQVSEDSPIAFNFFRIVGVNDSMIFTEELFECEQKVGAKYSTSPSGSLSYLLWLYVLRSA